MVTSESRDTRETTDVGEPTDVRETTDTRESLSIDRLDVIQPGAFAATVAPLFERARRFLGRLAVARPFGTAEGMFDRAREIAHSMPLDEQIELIDAHPRLGAPPASVSALSFVEQGYATGASEPAAASAPHADRRSAADHASAAPDGDLAAELERLNAAYEARFGFRYCVFVAGRSRRELLPDVVAALEADRDAEIARALDAVIDIARDRYAKLTAGPEDRP